MMIPWFDGAAQAFWRIRLAVAPRAVVLTAVLVASIAFLAFFPALRCGFVHVDDGNYVAHNPDVAGGLTVDGVKAAFRVFNGEYWVPVLFISLMADAQFFGPGPMGFHLVNVLLHCGNAVLLFGLLHAATRRLGPSLFASLLFAVHPLRVESVAWVAQRKDVLSAFLLLLALASYGVYAKRSGRGRWPWYGLSCGLYVSSLMTRPLAVSFPLLLLLADVWPLGRASLPDGSLARWFAWNRRLLVEKIPFLSAAAAFGALTLALQMRLSTPSLGLPALLLPALRTPFVALGRMVCPVALGLRFQNPSTSELASSTLQALLMHAVILALLWRLRGRHPHLLFGWFWFLASLLPSVGVAAFGGHWAADRFSYLPMMGACAGAAFALDRPAASGKGRAAALAVSIALLAFLAAATHRQIGHWANPRALAERSVRIAPGDPRAWFSLGNALFNERDLPGALSAMDEAVRLDPGSALARGGLGMVLLELGDWARARRHLEEGFRLGFTHPDARFLLGRRLFEEGDCAGTVAHLTEALRQGLSPDRAAAARGMIGACRERLRTPSHAD